MVASGPRLGEMRAIVGGKSRGEARERIVGVGRDARSSSGTSPAPNAWAARSHATRSRACVCAPPLLLCQCHRRPGRRHRGNDGHDGHFDCSRIIVQPLRDLRAARAARRPLCAQCKAAVKRARQVPSLHSEFLPQPAPSAVATGLRGAGDRRADAGPARCARRIASRFPADGASTRRSSRSARPCPSPGISRRTNRRRRRAASASRWRRARRPPRRCAHDAGCARSRRRHRVRRTKAPPGTRRSRRSNGRVPPASPARSPGASPAGNPARDARSAGTGRCRRRSTRAARTASRRPHRSPPTDAVAASPAAPAPETQAAPTADRRQLLAAAMSRCERENVLVGFVLQGAGAAAVSARANGATRRSARRRREQQHALAPRRRPLPRRSRARRRAAVNRRT